MRLLYYLPTPLIIFSVFRLNAQTPNAPDLIAQTAATYQKATTYQDAGTVVMRVRTGSNVGIFKMNFKTQFWRPKNVFSLQRYQKNTKNEWECYAIVGNDKEGWKSLSTKKGDRQRFESLLQAIVVSSEFSQSVSYKVPSLLLNQTDASSWNILSVRDWEVVGPIMIETQNTWHLKGSLTEADVKQVEVFIDQQTLLIRRLLFATATAITVVDYQSIVNFSPAELVMIDEQNYCIER
jgi:hypothetical protein